MSAGRRRACRFSYVGFFVGAACLTSIVLSGSQQSVLNEPRIGIGSITGRVVADNGAPARHVLVQLSVPMPPGGRGGARTSPQGPQTTETDDSGRFAFARAEAGTYNITAVGSGFVRALRWHTCVVSAGPPTVVNLTLVRTGVISGRIVDESRRPVVRARVTAARYETRSTGRQLVAPAGAAMGSTDDRGQFRLFDLPPGDYYVSALAGPAVVGAGSKPVQGYAPAFYPGAVNIQQARPVSVRPGREARGVTFPLRRVPLATISGAASDSLGRPLQSGAAVTLVPRSEAQPGGQFGNAVSTDGHFVLQNVPPGEYHLIVRMSGTQGREAAFRPVIVNGENMTVNIQTNAGATISGSVRLEGDPSRLRTISTTVNGAMATGAVRVGVRGAPPSVDAPAYTMLTASPPPQVLAALGPFVLEGLRGSLALDVTANGAVLKNVLRGTEDIAGTELALEGTERIENVTVVLTTETGTLWGVLTGVQDERLERTLVVVFPDEPGRWSAGVPFVHVSRPLTSATLRQAPSPLTRTTNVGYMVPGGFIVPQLLPGRYRVIAVEDTDPSQTVATDRATLEKLRPRATEVVVTAGQSTSVTVPGGIGRR
jgi:hypothetical protein